MPERVLVGGPTTCTMSDLPPDQCWHCRPPVEEPPSLEPEPHSGGVGLSAWPGHRTDTFVNVRFEASGSGAKHVVAQQIARRYGHAPDTVVDDDWDA